MEDLEYEIKNDYLNLVNNLEIITIDDFYECANYLLDCEILENEHDKKLYKINKNFKRKLYLIKMKELLLKSNSLLPNTIIDNIIFQTPR